MEKWKRDREGREVTARGGDTKVEWEGQMEMEGKMEMEG